MIDAALTVHHDDKESSLSCTLAVHRPQVVTVGPEEVRLSRSVDKVLDALFGVIEQFPDPSETDDEGRQTAIRRLQGMGEQIFDELLPAAIRDRLQHLPTDASLQIVSNETIIPWELLRMPDGTGDRGDGAFLAEAFCLTRWLVGSEQTTSLPLRRIAVVAPRDSGLDYTADEHDFVIDLDGGARRTADVEATPAEVMAAFDSGIYDGWHFTGHGMALSDDPNAWGLLLEDHRKLTSYDVRTAHEIRTTRPLVFANACSSGRGGPGLTRTGGLGRTFVEAGAGAYVGSHWTIFDASSFVFCRSFYESFLAGLPLGEAVRRARLVVRERFPGDPGWLAYTVFGHPSASCRKAVKEDAEETPETPPPGPFRRRLPPALRRRLLIAALVVSPLLLALFGDMAHRSRETMLRLNDHLTYPSATLLATGADATASLFMNALTSPFSSRPQIRASAWTLIVLTALCFAAFRWQGSRTWPGDLATWTAVLLLGGGILLYTLALRARHPGERPRDSNALCSNYFTEPDKPAPIDEQVVVESCSWLAHPTETNEPWRQNLSGLALYFLTASLVVLGCGLRQGRRRGWREGVRLAGIAAHVVVLALVLRLLPLAYAYDRWGLDYPVAELGVDCCRYYVSEGADEALFLVWGPACPERRESRDGEKPAGMGRWTVSMACPE